MLNSWRVYVPEVIKHTVLIGLVIGLAWVGSSFSCAKIQQGFSYMSPYVNEGSVVLIDKRPVHEGRLNPEDVVCYSFMASDQPISRAGRVVAMPGEIFQVKGGTFIVDDRIRDTAAIAGIRVYEIPPIMVPEGHVLVMFDRPYASQPLLDNQLVAFSDIRGIIWKWEGSSR